MSVYKFEEFDLEDIAQALSHAQYEVIEDEEPYYGEVPGLAGVYATGRSLEECRENLKNVIEGWILARREYNLAVESIFRKAGFAEEVFQDSF